MSLVTPTTKEISDNIIAQLESALNQSVPLLPKSFLRVLSRALAGVFVLLYKYGGWISLQQFVATAADTDVEINGVTVNPLVEWGRLNGTGDPAPATNAELTVDITVINQGGSLASGTQLVGDSNGVTYILSSGVLLNAGVVSGTVRAVGDQSGGTGAGAVGNLDPGATLAFADSLADVARETIVAAQVVTGADRETTAAYRQRVIDRFQKRPQGGAYSDYELWGEEPPGIVNVYPYTAAVPGQVDLFVEATPESAGDPDGIPTAAQLGEVLDSINFGVDGRASRRPANAFVNVYPITRTGFDVRVLGIADVDNLAAVQADITQALTEYFLTAEPYISGLSVPPRNDRITRTRISSAVEDIVTAAGGTFSSAVFYRTVDGGGSLVSYALAEGEKAKAATVAFI